MLVSTTLTLTTASGNEYPSSGFLNVYMTEHGIRSGTSQFDTEDRAKRNITRKPGVEYLGTIRISEYLSGINDDFLKGLLIQTLDRRLAHLVGKPELLDPKPTFVANTGVLIIGTDPGGQDERLLPGSIPKAKRNVAKAPSRPRILFDIWLDGKKSKVQVKARTEAEAIAIYTRKHG